MTCHFLKLLNCVSALTVTEAGAGAETEITATVMTVCFEVMLLNVTMVVVILVMTDMR